MSVCSLWNNTVKISQFPFTRAYSQASRGAAGHSSEITGQWCNLISDSILGNVRCLLKVDWMVVLGFWHLHGQTVVCMIDCCSTALASLDSCGQWCAKVRFTSWNMGVGGLTVLLVPRVLLKCWVNGWYGGIHFCFVCLFCHKTNKERNNSVSVIKCVVTCIILGNSANCSCVSKKQRHGGRSSDLHVCHGLALGSLSLTRNCCNIICYCCLTVIGTGYFFPIVDKASKQTNNDNS